MKEEDTGELRTAYRRGRIRGKAVQKEKQKFNVQFAVRLKAGRQTLDFTQQEMADALSTDLENYKKYERGINGFPSLLIPALVELTGHSSWYWLTGQPDSREKDLTA